MSTGDAINKIVDQINAAIAQYGPEGIKLAEKVIQFGAIGKLLLGVIFLIVGVALAFGTLQAWKKGWGTKHRTYAFYDDAGRRVTRSVKEVDENGSILYAIAGAFSLGSCITSLAFLLNYWNWITAFAPEIGLAHQIAVRVLGQ